MTTRGRLSGAQTRHAVLVKSDANYTEAGQACAFEAKELIAPTTMVE